MHIKLIGNYRPDRQESMLRFAQMLQAGLIRAGHETEIWWPTVFLGRFAKSTNAGIGKWLGYLDKWVLFPVVLKWKLLNISPRDVLFHVCDHSNAPYLKHLPLAKTAITCHDVIAIRGGLGYADAYCDASKMGKILQRWIFKNLIKAKLIAAVSELTLAQLKELVSSTNDTSKNWRVINNAFNAEFRPIEASRVKKLILKAGLDPQVPYILHVGSGVPRKNRRMLLDMAQGCGNVWNGKICFAGEPLDESLLSIAKSFNMAERIVSVIKPDHDTLVALYNGCDAFIFPSFSEGFGWPVIEAQACGAPVVTSNIEPMPEISGGAALYADPNNAKEFVEALLSLQGMTKRSTVIEQGIINASRFSSDKMIDAYLDLYNMRKSTSKNYASQSN